MGRQVAGARAAAARWYTAAVTCKAVRAHACLHALLSCWCMLSNTFIAKLALNHVMPH